MPTTETEGSSPALFLDPSCHIAQVGLSSSSINAHPFRVPRSAPRAPHLNSLPGLSPQTSIFY